LREYKKAYISTRLRIVTEWLNFFPEFLEGTTSHWFERQTKALRGSWNDIIKAIMKEFSVKKCLPKLNIWTESIKARGFKVSEKV
jgi:hypothetical protein